jgi:hypothetical protein
MMPSAFLDVHNPFNGVWHEGLRQKLKLMGIPVHIVKWVPGFLNNRSIYIDYKSTIFLPLAGVPQGSVIAPILFILYVTGFPEMSATLSKFADDIALWYCSRSLTLAVTKLHDSLNLVATFSEKWRIFPLPRQNPSPAVYTRTKSTSGYCLPAPLELVQIEGRSYHLG